MEREKFPKKDNLLSSKYLVLISSIVALNIVAFGAANGVSRDEVKDRSNGKCECCGKVVNKIFSIIGHLNHTKDDEYDYSENLRRHCVVCELTHHLGHWKNAATIGLSEENNDTAIITWLAHLIKKQPTDFNNFVLQNNELVAEFLKSRDYTIKKFKKEMRRRSRKVVKKKLKKQLGILISRATMHPDNHKKKTTNLKNRNNHEKYTKSNRKETNFKKT